MLTRSLYSKARQRRTLIHVLLVTALCYLPAYPVLSKGHTSLPGSRFIQRDIADRILRLPLYSQQTDTATKRSYNLWNDTRDMGRHFVSDATHVYSSPARLNGNTVVLVGGLVGLGAVIYVYDQEIYDAFQRSKNDRLYKPIRKLGERFERLGYMGTSNKFMAGGLLFSYLVHWDKGVSICSDVLESHFIAGGVKNFANLVAGRARPYEGFGPRHFQWNEGTSFPSGHASNIVQMASVFTHHINYLPFTVGAYTIAGAVSLERITSSGHWPSDVYFAIVYGWVVSKEILRLNEDRRIRTVPVIDSERGTVGLAISIRL